MPRNVNYKFSPNISPNYIKVVEIVDKIFNVFNSKESSHKNLMNFENITIVQLAHIGDLILLLPAIKKLKVVSKAQITLVVGEQNLTLAKHLTFIDQVLVANAPYFSRIKKRSYFSFIKELRNIKTELLVDVRADLRNLFFLKLFTRKKTFIGFDIGGGGGLLDAVLPYPISQHILNLLNPLFQFLNFKEDNIENYWNINDLPYDVIKDIPSNYIIIHIGAGTQAKQWPINYFLKLIEMLSKKYTVCVLGMEKEINLAQKEQLKLYKNVISYIGKSTMLESIYLVRNCTYFVGLDSGFSHIASFLKRNIFVIFSGTTNPDVWSPYEFYHNQVKVIKKFPPCSMITGCGKFRCDHNICMTEVLPLEVFNVIENANMLTLVPDVGM